MIASYAQQRVTFGRPLANRQAVQFAVADLYTKLQAGQLLTYRTACKVDNGTLQPPRHFHGQDVLHRARLRGRRPLHAVPWRHRHGHGNADRADVARSRSFMITGGPAEIMRASLAREIFTLYQ